MTTDWSQDYILVIDRQGQTFNTEMESLWIPFPCCQENFKKGKSSKDEPYSNMF